MQRYRHSSLVTRVPSTGTLTTWSCNWSPSVHMVRHLVLAPRKLQPTHVPAYLIKLLPRLNLTVWLTL
jgi:hypothetical protein